MGMLSNILDKLGLNRADPKPAAVAQSAAAAQTGTFGQTAATAQPAGAAPTGTQAPPAAPATPAGQAPAGQSPAGGTPTGQAPAGQAPRAAPVDVTAKLESLAAASREKLNWRESIVDLLKLLGMDSSLAARKELASELGCPSDKMADSAQMNIWLHKAVVRKMAENGGTVPKELLD